MHVVDAHRDDALPNRHGAGLPWTCIALALLVLALLSTSWAGEDRNHRPGKRKPGLADELALRRPRGTVIWPRADGTGEAAAVLPSAPEEPVSENEPEPSGTEAPAGETAPEDATASPESEGRDAAGGAKSVPGRREWPVRRSPEECAADGRDPGDEPAGRPGGRSGRSEARDGRDREERKTRRDAAARRKSGPWWKNSRDQDYADPAEAGEADGADNPAAFPNPSPENGNAPTATDGAAPHPSATADLPHAAGSTGLAPRPTPRLRRGLRRPAEEAFDAGLEAVPLAAPVALVTDTAGMTRSDSPTDPSADAQGLMTVAAGETTFWSGPPNDGDLSMPPAGWGADGENVATLSADAAAAALPAVPAAGIAAAPEPPTREEVEDYRRKLEERLLERYNNLPEYAGRVGKVRVILSRPVEESIDGMRIRAEFDQLVYDPWGVRMPQLEEEYYVVTFGVGGAREVRADPSIRVGLDLEKTYSETAPLAADPFRNVEPSRAFAPAPSAAMPDWWRPEY